MNLAPPLGAGADLSRRLVTVLDVNSILSCAILYSRGQSAYASHPHTPSLPCLQTSRPAACGRCEATAAEARGLVFHTTELCFTLVACDDATSRGRLAGTLA